MPYDPNSNTSLCMHPPHHTLLGGPVDGEQEPFEDEVGQLLGDNVEEEEEEEGEDLFGDNLERCVSDIPTSIKTHLCGGCAVLSIYLHP